MLCYNISYVAIWRTLTMRKSIPFLLMLGSLCTPAIAQQSAHVHGVASMNLAIDEKEIQIEFVSPADGIVGFEYEPSNTSEHQAVKDAITLLRNPETLFSLPRYAECDLHEVEVERHAEGEHDEHGHNNDHDEHGYDDHAHLESDMSGSHSEFHAHYHFDCNGSPISEIELTLFKNWPKIETLEVQALTPNGQTGGNINASNPVIRLP